MEKVKAGDKVVIRASTWNAFIDAANWTKEQRQNQLGKGLRSGGVSFYAASAACSKKRAPEHVQAHVCADHSGLSQQVFLHSIYSS